MDLLVLADFAAPDFGFAALLSDPASEDVGWVELAAEAEAPFAFCEEADEISSAAVLVGASAVWREDFLLRSPISVERAVVLVPDFSADEVVRFSPLLEIAPNDASCWLVADSESPLVDEVSSSPVLERDGVKATTLSALSASLVASPSSDWPDLDATVPIRLAAAADPAIAPVEGPPVAVSRSSTTSTNRAGSVEAAVVVSSFASPNTMTGSIDRKISSLR